MESLPAKYWTHSSLLSALESHLAAVTSEPSADLEAALVMDRGSRIDSALSPAQQLEHWVALGGLLARLAGQGRWRQLARVASRIHELEHQLGLPSIHSDLFRGIAHLGERETAIGMRCVFRALRGTSEYLDVGDKSLAQAALATAALQMRNPSLALLYVNEWLAEAVSVELDAEILRAHLAKGSLLAILGHRDDSSTVELLKRIATTGVDGNGRVLPSSWLQAAQRVSAWLSAEHDSETVDSPSSVEEREAPVLFVGLEQIGGREPKSGQGDVRDFEEMCELRRRLSCPAALKDFSTENLSRASRTFARWELALPLSAVEHEIRERDPGIYYRSLMSRLLGQGVTKTVTTQPQYNMDRVLEERSDVVIWMADVQRYAALSEQFEPAVLYHLLSPVFKIISEALEAVGGMVHEFVGDAIMVVFNAFDDRSVSAEDVFNQTSVCLRRIHHLAALYAGQALPPLSIGVGIHSGSAGLGYLGGLSRCHLATLGNTTNIAARLESATRQLPSPVAISEGLFSQVPPNPWENPDSVQYSLRDLGEHSLKHIEAPVRIYGLDTLIHYWVEFVPMGFVAASEPGVVYLDTGNCSQPGIFDTHEGECDVGSSCELVLQQADALQLHLADVPETEIEFRLHENPDLDCVAALYVAQELLSGSPRKAMLAELAAYVSLIDQGFSPEPDTLSDSLYAVFLVHQRRSVSATFQSNRNFTALEAGLRVVDAAMFIREQEGAEAGFDCVFGLRPTWFKEERSILLLDRKVYLDDFRRGTTYQARVVGVKESVTGLWLDHPKSQLFKVWARSDPRAPGGRGFGFMAVDFSTAEKHRVVISVDPNSGTTLQGLGVHLEMAEADRRKALGQERPREPRRYPADNADPWYFGQGNDYTIVDSPARGSILEPTEIRRLHEAWRPT